MKEQTDKLAFIKIKKSSALQQILLREWKEKPQSEEKMFSSFISDYLLVSRIKNSQNSIIIIIVVCFLT